MSEAFASAERRLLTAVSSGRVMHAIFIDCPPPLGALLARRAAACYCLGTPDPSLLGSCADFLELSLDTATVKLDVRDLLGELAKRPFHERGRAVLITLGELKNDNVQNALLKTVEEPPDNTLLLLTGSESRLLPTIRSRCALLRCAPDASDTEAYLASLGASPRDAARFTLEGGTPHYAVRLYQEPEFREFRKLALTALFSMLAGHPAYDSVKSLSQDYAAALHFFQLGLEEALRLRTGGSLSACRDLEAELLALTQYFTSGKLFAIIRILGEPGRFEIKTAKQAPAVLDWLFTRINQAVSSAG